MSENIQIICGSDGNVDELQSIKSNPNFVFENDPEFQTVVLFNESGDVINVNSWLECANYVNGGWSDIIPGTIIWEKNLMIIYIVTISAFLLFRKFKKTSSKL